MTRKHVSKYFLLFNSFEKTSLLEFLDIPSYKPKYLNASTYFFTEHML